ncbi:xanthine dehydrogenase subunit D [Rubrobacter tropicus]|uniref:Xanthine dehydrogenase subunit D n=1 Tax=Rubrobacter tropicus TaxID=2653851 RepID=A0A6G8QBN3_9ACTN|nr:xanthine dehydrogenase subunit D [Rubrobacter tropicus]QIN83914.1 xanthine dehydrogenase subunit D [Rubrobacter tropicus]
MKAGVGTPLAPVRPVAPVQRPGKIGEESARIDGIPKVTGEYEYASDLWMDGMLHGATLRSPHPHAKIVRIDTVEAEELAGVYAVLTHEDVPGRKVYGMEIPDQPVLAWEKVRYQGEPVAVVAADHPETARRALERIRVDYDVLAPVTSAEEALAEEAPKLHLSGNLLRRVKVLHGEPADAAADVVVTGEYEIGMQDQAFLGPEAGLAVPDGLGGVDLYISTQWLHIDRDQVAESLGLAPDRVRLTLSGVGGAFGGREDLSMQVHSCMLALETGRPVRMVYNREESFYGHVHRHPARMRYEHGATRDGKLLYVKANLVFDGGAYASSSNAVCLNAATFACGPYDVPRAEIESLMLYTNNPPCGAMRGFGAVQACFAHESQMDKLAEKLGMHPLELRLKNAIEPGMRFPFGQEVPPPAPVREILEKVKNIPMPAEQDLVGRDLRELPGGVSNVTHGEDVKRGVGYAVGFKNIGFSAGFDDYSTARVTLSVEDGEPLVRVHTAAAEVGQGLVTLQAQIARTELGVERVAVEPADTRVGSAGSTSASRQSYVTGAAVKGACEAIRERLFERVREEFGGNENLTLDGNEVLSSGRVIVSLGDLIGAEEFEETLEYHHKETHPLNENGQGDAHLQFAFAAHRAVVEVDTELGLVRVVEIATAQDVGKVMNPQALEGQIEGGIAQGLGLALLEEIQVKRGKVLNASFTDYLLPTILDMPPVKMEILELSDPEAPYGLKGVGEPPTISSTPAIVAALRDATGRPLTRIPAKPEQIAGITDRPPAEPPHPGSAGYAEIGRLDERREH